MSDNKDVLESLRWKKFPVLDDGFVCLVDAMGDEKYVKTFVSRIRFGPVSDCWEWSSTKDSRGYGLIRTKKGLFKAHRLVMILASGKTLSSDECVLHLCDNTSCCNPSHLRVGTHLENMRDMFSKGRRIAASGEKSGTAKLTSEQVAEIRRSHIKGSRKRGVRASDLAAKYGVTRQTINHITRNASWINT